MSKLQTLAIEVSQDLDGWQRVTLAGPLNEEAKVALMPLLFTLSVKVVFDFHDVNQMNSSGIRDWGLFLKQVKGGRTIEFDRCSGTVIQAINMVPNFAGGVTIRSIDRDFACTHCKHQLRETLTRGADYQAGTKPVASEKRCPKCLAPMEPIESDDEFFLFLQNPFET